MSVKLFVFATGRNGTHTLAKILSFVPRTISLHEGRGYYKGKFLNLSDMKSLNIYIYKISSNKVYLYNKLFNPKDDIQHLIDLNFEQRKKLIRYCEINQINFCDINRVSYNYINYIYKLYPDAKFIHLVRNGYDCVRSWNSRIGIYPEYSIFLKKKYIKYFYRTYIKNDIKKIIGNMKKSIKSYVYINKDNSTINKDLIRTFNYNTNYNYIAEKPVPIKTDYYFYNWKYFDRIQKISWFWKEINQIILDRLSLIPDEQKLLVKLEDLSKEKIIEILNFSGLPPSFSESTLKSHDKRNHKFIWSNYYIKKFNEIAENTMKKLGYNIR